ncbi:hypothetical protein ACL02S_22895 [Nocardia sp. 004]|uniref:hypothetical protein n=1 Tax=Nocardia sp. 004 TaxID=3385978 RepID=UPI0039A2C7CE
MGYRCGFIVHYERELTTDDLSVLAAVGEHTVANTTAAQPTTERYQPQHEPEAATSLTPEVINTINEYFRFSDLCDKAYF